MTIIKNLRNIIGKLGLKQVLLPVYDMLYKRQALREMSKYDNKSTNYDLNTEKRTFELIVSLTTFPARIKSASYVIDTLMRQTYKPDKIILNLAHNEITPSELPEEYENLQTRGLSIEFVDNLKPHNKYLYTMKKSPNSVVVTVDDDILYSENLLKDLVKSYEKHPNCVSTMRAHRILFRDNKILPYNLWEYESTYSWEPQFDLFATGVGGVLYPPNCMHEDVFSVDTIKSISLENDDIWMKFMQLKKKTPVVLAGKDKPKLLYIPASQKMSLWSENRDNNRNNKIMKACKDFLKINDADFIRMLAGN